METVERDFAPQGVKFYYIYKALAHPGASGYITPFTQAERLMHVAEAKHQLGSRIDWLCDTMANDAKHAWGDAPNSEFVIDPAGKIVVSRRWSQPDELRRDLEKLVGEVENPTTIADLGMQPLKAPQTAPMGVVPRLELPGRMHALRVERAPLVDDAISEPLYVKLRAELDPEYENAAVGKLYFGFFLDPLYKVHWNNEVAAVTYTVEPPAGLEVTPLRGEGPQVTEKADADPREFLLEISGESEEPIKVIVQYFACDDAETFCKPVTQHYLVSLQRDRDGGSRRTGRGRSPGFAGGPRPSRPEFGAREGLSFDSQMRRGVTGDEGRRKRLKQAIAVFRDFDADRDGTLDAEEFSPLENILIDVDTSGDGLVSLRELMDVLNRVSVRSSPQPERHETSRVLLATMDLDGDGVLAAEELVQAGDSLLQLDRDKDGEISADELESATRMTDESHPPRSSDNGRANRFGTLERLDRNGDGKITKEEVPEPMQRRWDRMDRDGNGFLDQDEQAFVAERLRKATRGQRPQRPTSD